ncbi:FtsX-like permease family protein [Streptomyces collinus]|uniref:FtsX-like permease family protein n=1 Tax=Streptomyces collinus TaxID=42684 RepID=UPI0036C444B6
MSVGAHDPSERALADPVRSRTPTAGRPDPDSTRCSGILATTSAAPQNPGTSRSATIYLKLAPAVPDAIEPRTAVVRQDPRLPRPTCRRPDGPASSSRFTPTCVLLLIGASLLVSQIEQLREHKRLLSALVPFGTWRTTLSTSVLWETALPVALGLLLSTAAGLALGTTMLLQMSLAPATVAGRRSRRSAASGRHSFW